MEKGGFVKSNRIFFCGLLISFLIISILSVSPISAIGSTNYNIGTPQVSPGGNISSTNYWMKTVLETIAGFMAGTTYDTQLGFFAVNSVYNSAPIVFIISPIEGAFYNSGVDFEVNSTAVGTGNIVPNLDDSLVSWWRMDDLNSSGGVVDYMGRNNGTAVADAHQTGGYFGKGFGFDGATDHILVGDKLNLNPPEITVSSWFKLYSGGDSYNYIVSNSRDCCGSYNGTEFRVVSDNRLYAKIWNETSSGVYSTGALSINEWYHGAFTYDGANIKLYINGILNATTASTLGIGSTPSYPFAIGGMGMSPSTFQLNGSLDDVMVFNRSLSADEILGLYNATAINHTSSISEGSHTYVAYSQNREGDISSDNVSFNVDTLAPDINYENDTDEDASAKPNSDIFVNVSASDVGKGDNNISAFINFDSSLVGWWRMDDVNASGDVVDYFGRNNGTRVNALQTDAGYFGKGFEFDGGNSYINVPTNNEINTALGAVNDFTISTWIKPDKFVNYGTIGRAGACWSYTANALWITGSGFRCAMGDANTSHCNSAGSYIGTSYYAPSLNNWYNVVCMGNGTHLQMYVNGIAQGSAVAISGITLNRVDGTNPLRMGTRYGDSTSSINGTIDDVMIFNRSLTANEIAALYANSSIKYVSNNFTGLSDGNHTFKAYTQDIAGNVNFTDTRSVSIRFNTPPTIELLSPSNGNLTTDRTPTFTYNGSDDQGDSLAYYINITGVGFSVDNVLIENYTGGESYTLTDDLQKLYDNGDYYHWSVRACENETAELYCSDWADAWTINISAIVSINLTNDFINFGSMIIDESKNTTDVSLTPLTVQNDGNSRVNVSMNATQLWDSVVGASDNFMSKIRAYAGNSTWANITWFQLPPITGSVVVASDLNYSDTSDELDVDVLLTVPTNEPPGNKTSIINFRATLSEI